MNVDGEDKKKLNRWVLKGCVSIQQDKKGSSADVPHP